MELSTKGLMPGIPFPEKEFKRRSCAGFHDLPPEIRLQIYEYCSPSIAVLSTINRQTSIRELDMAHAWRDTNGVPTKALRILQLDRKIQAEATTFLYGYCTFTTNPDPYHDGIFGRTPDPEQTIPPIHKWVIDLRWDLWRDRPLIKWEDRFSALFGVLCSRESTTTISLKYPCDCALIDRSPTVPVHTTPSSRIQIDTKYHRALFEMLGRLAELRRHKKVEFDPTDFCWIGDPLLKEPSRHSNECQKLVDIMKDIVMTETSGCERALKMLLIVQIYAEAPPEPPQLSRKPIYDDLPPLRPKPQPDTKSSEPSGTSPTAPTPTDRLASQIRRVRLSVHDFSSTAETRFNDLMSQILTRERSFTSTIASLAPPLESNEKVMPGALYVLVAAMSGSILTRNRNVLLRATVPFAVGVGAAWIVLPVTTRNVADLVWRFEERAPVVAENHLWVRGAAVEGWKQIRERGGRVKGWSDERVRDGREAVEGWVRKGR
ncbi:MAG: hypothetical protein Q9219_005923 [cf. Caloplaca sp. 3 TL-2023]